MNGILSCIYEDALTRGPSSVPTALKPILKRANEILYEYQQMEQEHTPGVRSAENEWKKIHRAIFDLCLNAFPQIDAAAREDASFAGKAQVARQAVANMAVAVVKVGVLGEACEAAPLAYPVLAKTLDGAKKAMKDAEDNSPVESDPKRADHFAAAAWPYKAPLAHALATNTAAVSDEFAVTLWGSDGSSYFLYDMDDLGVSSEDRMRIFERFVAALGNASGLEEGRLPAGLIALIVNYLKAADTSQGKDDDTVRQREREAGRRRARAFCEQGPVCGEQRYPVESGGGAAGAGGSPGAGDANGGSGCGAGKELRRIRARAAVCGEFDPDSGGRTDAAARAQRGSGGRSCPGGARGAGPFLPGRHTRPEAGSSAGRHDVGERHDGQHDSPVALPVRGGGGGGRGDVGGGHEPEGCPDGTV